MIQIGKPYITSNDDISYLNACVQISLDTANKYIRLQEKLPNAIFLTHTDYPPRAWSNEDFSLWFSVEKKYEKYLCVEKTDAFVVMLLWYAMATGSDIKFEAPISSELYNNLTTKLIPQLMKDDSIRLIGPQSDEVLKSENKVATGLTCGVDSFYSAINYSSQYKNNKPNIDLFTVYQDDLFGPSHKKMRLQTAFNCLQQWTDTTADKARHVADALNKPLVYVKSNYWADIYRGGVIYSGMYKYCACTLALEKLIGRYYDSDAGNGKSIEKGLFVPSQHYEDLLIECFKTENFSYLQDTGTLRIQKIIELADNPLFQKYANVCFNYNNCGECYGCWKTMLCLDFIDKLDMFTEVWNVADFMQNRKRHYADFIKFCNRPEATSARQMLEQLISLINKYDNPQTKLFKDMYKSQFCF